MIGTREFKNTQLDSVDKLSKSRAGEEDGEQPMNIIIIVVKQ